jgi:hypothetical protein
MVGKPRKPHPHSPIPGVFRRGREADVSEKAPEEMSRGQWHGVYHPDARPNSDGAAPFIKAYALEGVIEFSFTFVRRTFDKAESRIPGKSATKVISYDAPYDGTTPHFIAMNSFSGRFLTSDGKLTERPLGAFEVDLRIEKPGFLACTVRLSDKNSDDPVEIKVRGVLVFFQ